MTPEESPIKVVGIEATMPALRFDLRRLKYCDQLNSFPGVGLAIGVAGAELLETVLLCGNARCPPCGNARSPLAILLFIFVV